MELGCVARGVGFLVGVAVRYTAHLSEIDESMTLGVYSAIVAAGSIMLAKFGLYYVLIALAGLSGEIPFTAMFSLFDLIWFAFACVTAFKIGIGN